MQYASVTTPVGPIGVLADEHAVRRIGWSLRPPAEATGGELAERAAAQLVGYFAGDRTAFDLPVDLSRLEPGTRAVLTALAQTVGYGETVTYGELAVRSGTGIPPRGVGAVMGANPVPIVVPCHRVLAADGLGGFSGGERGREHETKIWLLEHEGALPPALW